MRGQRDVAQTDLLPIPDDPIHLHGREAPDAIVGVAARRAMFERPAVPGARQQSRAAIPLHLRQRAGVIRMGMVIDQQPDLAERHPEALDVMLDRRGISGEGARIAPCRERMRYAAKPFVPT